MLENKHVHMFGYVLVVYRLDPTGVMSTTLRDERQRNEEKSMFLLLFRSVGLNREKEKKSETDQEWRVENWSSIDVRWTYQLCGSVVVCEDMCVINERIYSHLTSHSKANILVWFGFLSISAATPTRGTEGVCLFGKVGAVQVGTMKV